MGLGILLQYSHHHLAKNIVPVLRKNTSSLAFESFRRGWCSPSTHPLVRQHRDLPGVREFLPCWKDQIRPNHGWNRRKPIFLEGCLKFVLSPLPSRIQILLLKWSFDLDMFMLYLYHQISKKRLWKTLEGRHQRKSLGVFGLCDSSKLFAVDPLAMRCFSASSIAKGMHGIFHCGASNELGRNLTSTYVWHNRTQHRILWL